MQDSRRALAIQGACKVKELWNKLSKQQRYALLVKAYPSRSWELHNLEAKLKWHKLLPSTQRDLERLAQKEKDLVRRFIRLTLKHFNSTGWCIERPDHPSMNEETNPIGEKDGCMEKSRENQNALDALREYFANLKNDWRADGDMDQTYGIVASRTQAIIEDVEPLLENLAHHVRASEAAVQDITDDLEQEFWSYARGIIHSSETPYCICEKCTAMGQLFRNIVKPHIRALASPSQQSQGKCKVTGTPRFLNPLCKCPTYADNLGPCLDYEQGANGRCVYCDHEKLCHDQLDQQKTRLVVMQCGWEEDTHEGTRCSLKAGHSGAHNYSLSQQSPVPPLRGAITKEDVDIQEGMKQSYDKWVTLVKDARQLELLQARLEEAEWWKKIGMTPYGSDFAVASNKRIADLRAQIEAAKEPQ